MSRLWRYVACAALALAAFGTPARAADDSTWAGDCSLGALHAPGSDETYTGEIDAQIALHSWAHGNVVNATVTCEIRVNGVTQASASAWGTGVVVVADTVTYTASVVDYVVLCTVVDFTSDSTPTKEHCPGPTTLEMPPRLVQDVIGWPFLIVDPIVCEVLSALAPGAGPFAVTDEGDVAFDGAPFWDCPPHEFPPSGGGFDPLPPYDPPGTLHLPSGAGYNAGTAGLLLLLAPTTVNAFAPDPGEQAASICAYGVDATGAITVAGASAGTATIRCRLEDTATGAMLYDETASGTLRGSVPANAGPVTVCTEGAQPLACRPGEPLDRVVPEG